MELQGLACGIQRGERVTACWGAVKALERHEQGRGRFTIALTSFSRLEIRGT